MAADKHVIPTHLDDPELIGLWTLDEFLAMVISFVWGILSQHILIVMLLSGAGWWGLRKAKAGRATSWLLQLAYWFLPAGFTGLRATPPSYLRMMAGGYGTFLQPFAQPSGLAAAESAPHRRPTPLRTDDTAS